jgi:MFS family permease
MTENATPPRPTSRLARLPFFYGWVVIGVAFVTMGIGVNTRTAFSLLYPPILDEFGWERGETAAIFTIGFVVTAAITPFIGVLMDRFGPRMVLPIGGVLSAAGMGLTTLATTPLHFYLTLGALVVGGSVFMSYIGHSMFLPNWFTKKRGLAIGIAFSGVGVGSIILFPWLQHLIDEVGWRAACLAIMGLLIVLVLPLNLVLIRGFPRDIGLTPDGGKPADAASGAGAVDNVVDREWAETDWTLARAAATGRFWWVSLAFLTGLFAWYAVQVHQTKYLVDMGFDPAEAALALGLVGLTGIVGQIGLGHLSDRIGREWVWTISLVGFAACYLLLLALKSNPSPVVMYAMVASQGLLGYGLASLYGPIPAELFQGRKFATILGALSFAATLGAAGGPWVLGEIHDRTGSYDLGFWLALALALVSILAIWMAAPRKVRAVAGRVGK